MFEQITIKELPTLARVIKNQGKSNEEVLNDLTLIDDLLTLQKSKNLLNKKKSLKAQINARVDFELGYQPENTNRL